MRKKGRRRSTEKTSSVLVIIAFLIFFAGAFFLMRTIIQMQKGILIDSKIIAVYHIEEEQEKEKSFINTYDDYSQSVNNTHHISKEKTLGFWMVVDEGYENVNAKVLSSKTNEWEDVELRYKGSRQYVLDLLGDENDKVTCCVEATNEEDESIIKTYFSYDYNHSLFGRIVDFFT